MVQHTPWRRHWRPCKRTVAGRFMRSSAPRIGGARATRHAFCRDASAAMKTTARGRSRNTFRAYRHERHTGTQAPMRAPVVNCSSWTNFSGYRLGGTLPARSDPQPPFRLPPPQRLLSSAEPADQRNRLMKSLDSRILDHYGSSAELRIRPVSLRCCSMSPTSDSFPSPIYLRRAQAQTIAMRDQMSRVRGMTTAWPCSVPSASSSCHSVASSIMKRWPDLVTRTPL